jgi:hypothetical protein
MRNVAQAFNGEGRIRTLAQKPAKTVLFSEGGAESGAPTTLDPTLATLIDAWHELPQAIRAGIMAMVKAATLPVEFPSKVRVPRRENCK